MGANMNLFKGLVGGLLLFFGQRVFWLFVGGVGFAAGLELSNAVLASQPENTRLIAAIVLGVLGAVLALFLQKLAVALAGFFMGGLVVSAVLNMIGQQQNPLAWLFMLIGALIGAGLIVGLFNWALILLSSLGGAMLITQAFQLEALVSGGLFIVLFLVGFISQANTYTRAKRAKEDR
jgi:hypothetical protein